MPGEYTFSFTFLRAGIPISLYSCAVIYLILSDTCLFFFLCDPLGMAVLSTF